MKSSGMTSYTCNAIQGRWKPEDRELKDIPAYTATSRPSLVTRHCLKTSQTHNNQPKPSTNVILSLCANFRAYRNYATKVIWVSH